MKAAAYWRNCRIPFLIFFGTTVSALLCAYLDFRGGFMFLVGLVFYGVGELWRIAFNVLIRLDAIESKLKGGKE